MTKQEFVDLHHLCSRTLNEYMNAANKLCIMLGDCAEGQSNARQLSELAQQRSLENHLYAEYQVVRIKLLEAAKLGYGPAD